MVDTVSTPRCERCTHPPLSSTGYGRGQRRTCQTCHRKVCYACRSANGRGRLRCLDCVAGKNLTSPCSLPELALRINAHLQRFEADPAINVPRKAAMTVPPYYHAGAYYAGGPKIGVKYVSFQGVSKLSKAEAAAYLAWLDAGNAGTHVHQQRAAKRRSG